MIVQRQRRLDDKFEVDAASDLDGPEFEEGVLERFGDEVDVLVVLVLVRLDGAHVGLVGQQLRLAGQRVHQFSVAGQQSGAVRLQPAVLFAQAELHREPVHLRPKKKRTAL